MRFKNIFVYPKYPENLQRLYKLACNLWSTWNYDSIGLFYGIDTQLFRKVEHNPLKLLDSLSKEKLEALSNDKRFLYEFEKVWKNFQHYLQHADVAKDDWSKECSLEQDDVVAYFSMEFGLHEFIPLYAGGLGIFSGDFLKSVSDLDLPVVGIGLLYKYGYFTQCIDVNGHQQEKSRQFENHLLPIRELHDSKGNWAHIKVRMQQEDVEVKLWEIDVGKSKLILLDTDIEDNPPHLRDITNELYVGDREKRIQQELLLGIGGIRALDFLGIRAKIYHFNEGHSAFAIIGRLQNLMQNKKKSFSEARAIIQASTVFTTHTAVIAGNEKFDTALVKKYLEPKLKYIKLSFDQIAPLGYVNGNRDVFWLPAFAMQFSRHINGVSNQHAKISRKMWSSIFPERPITEIPIIPITNGVHASWISPLFLEMFKYYLGPNFIQPADKEDVWKNIYNIPDEELWRNHRRNKKDLVNFVKRRFARQMVDRGHSQARTRNVTRSFNMDNLTIVFARRFASYKRPTLILKDKERFIKILTNSEKPVQMIFAGKAHPADEQCKNMIKEVIDFAREYNVENKVIFLENYDINIARHLYWGADVWLNNPFQAMEACGTSGMKAAMNGVLHLSTLEGWWREGYNGKNGWAITAGNLYSKWDLQETADANQLYNLLENEITELYYSRNETDIPEGWVKMMKESLFSVCRHFNMNRVLSDYVKKSYLPAIKESALLSADNYKLLKQAIREEKEVLKYWDSAKIVSFSTNIEKKVRLTEAECVQAQCAVRFGEAAAELFKVELFYMYHENSSYRILPMKSTQTRDNTRYYEYLLRIEGQGRQKLNVRIRPANKIVQDMHPELIKWKN